MTETEHFLEKFVAPASVAIIGASNNELKNNYHLVGNLINLGFEGRIYPVNPKEKEVLGLKAYASVADIEEVVDLAVISVAATFTPGVLEECAKKGIKRVTLIAGGFSEIGEDGTAVQNRMRQLLKENNMRAIGPNALSPINIQSKFAVSFHEIKHINPGNLSLIFQSGLYEPAFQWLLSDFNFRFNKLIDLGNKMDINEVEALDFLIKDPPTKIIAIHMESFGGNGREFFNLLKKARDVGKRVIIIKTGRTSAGAKAAASHTGAMVKGSDVVFDGALKQAGALRVDTIESFFHVARGLDRLGDFSPAGNRVAIAMLPGGLGVMVTDLVERSGLKMAKAGNGAIKKMEKVFPGWEVAVNPWDLGVTMQFSDPITVYGAWMNAMTEDPNVDMLAFQVHQRMLMLGKDLAEIFVRAAKAGKPTAIWMNGKEPGNHDILKWVEDHGVPVFRFPEKAIQGLVALYKLSQPLS